MSRIELCVLCGEEVDPVARGTHKKITGWEAPRAQGGANQIVLREVIQPPEFAHANCIDLKRRGVLKWNGIPVQQPELFS